MDTSSNQVSQTRKTLMWAMTAVLWLATVGLGMLAFIVFQQGLKVATGILLLQVEDVGSVAKGGFWRIIQYTAVILSGLLWLGMVIGGMEYHFKRVGHRRSFRVFAWTIGIEIAIIVVGLILLQVS